MPKANATPFPATLRCPRILLAAVMCVGPWLASAAGPGPSNAMRCGWFDNPTPGNASLTDSQAEWTIGQQGGHQARGEWPHFTDRDWVRTSHGSAGYGCACLKVSTDNGKEQIVQIFSARARPLSACRKDPALKGKEPENPLADSGRTGP
ncbi:hypothetical protein GY15_23370 [Delftia sp. 670]|nr:hypothetical protein GY15_23370 [Delftia sp. 670]